METEAAAAPAAAVIQVAVLQRAPAAAAVAPVAAARAAAADVTAAEAALAQAPVMPAPVPPAVADLRSTADAVVVMGLAPAVTEALAAPTRGAETGETGALIVVTGIAVVA